ncbi:hypothetical protein PoB_002996600 [Plakobranchus ocellatus]|uniref:Uncharacterized protein n=1 Tax=Plakobranchus ocellatus TaxID=259542 RepID=A0AAV3ZWX6_9GAST|nr:hypothetical protein PoB_002996600 [Plakobranchus ocellatus]
MKPKLSKLSTSSVMPRQFLYDFENFSALCDIRGNSKLVATFQLHLTIEANWWFDDLPSDLRSSWANTKEAFQLLFIYRNSGSISDFIHLENFFPDDARQDMPRNSRVVLVQKRTKSEKKNTPKKHAVFGRTSFVLILDSLIPGPNNLAIQSPPLGTSRKRSLTVTQSLSPASISALVSSK